MTWDITQPVSSLTKMDRERWKPRISSGFFNVGDKRFYLYGNKRIATLAQIACTRFSLSPESDLLPYQVGTTIQVFVAGVPYNYWVLQGNDLIVAHFDADTFVPFIGSTTYNESEWERLRLQGVNFQPETVVLINYQAMIDTPPFVTNVARVFTFKEGTREYWLSEEPKIGAPIVLTDDTITLEQENKYIPQFSVNSSEELINYETDSALTTLRLKARLDITGQNLLRNPCFNELTTLQGSDFPDHWMITSAGVSFGRSTHPYHGRNVAYLYGGTWIQQAVDIGNAKQLSVTAYVKGWSSGSSATLGVAFQSKTTPYFINPDLSIATASSNTGYTQVSVSQSIGRDWTRLTILLGEVSDFITSVDSALVTDESCLLLVKITGTNVEVGAVKVEEGLIPSAFSVLNEHETTVEYEVSEDGVFVSSKKTTFPYDTADVDSNPINDPANNGFLNWKSYPFVDDYQLGIGGDTTVQDAYQWVEYLGTDTPTARATIAEYSASGASPIVVPATTTYGLTYPSADLLVYIDGKSYKINNADEQTIVRDSLVNQASSALGSATGFAGCVIDVGYASITGEINTPHMWSSVLRDVHDILTTGYPGQDIFGIKDAYGLLDPNVTTSLDLAQVVDYFVSSGVTRDRFYPQNTETEKRFRLFRNAQVIEQMRRSGNKSGTILVQDYLHNEDDFTLVAEAREAAGTWKHAIATDALSPVVSEGLVPNPYGFPSAIYQDAGETFGRKHLPYARLDGPGKLDYRASFNSNLPERDESSSFEVSDRPVARLSLFPSATIYKDAGVPKSVVLGYPNNPDYMYPYNTTISVLATDSTQSPCDGYPIHIQTDHGLLTSTNNVSGTGLVLFTDKAGFITVSYRISNTYDSDTVRVFNTRYGITGSMNIEVL